MRSIQHLTRHAFGQLDVVLSIVSAARHCSPRLQLWKLAAVNQVFRTAVGRTLRNVVYRILLHWFADPATALLSMDRCGAILTGTPAIMVAVELGFASPNTLFSHPSTATFFLPSGDLCWEVRIQ